MFYTYIHFRKDSGMPFYVGKGKKNRLFTKTKRNTHWTNISNKHGFNAEICSHWETENEALEHEKFLIACFKDIGIPLVNMTDGGEGTSGWIPTESWRKKRSDWQKRNFVNPLLNPVAAEKRRLTITGKSHSQEHKAKIAKASIGNKSRTGLKNTIESNLQRSKKLLGNKHGLGVKHTLESNQKRSESLKAYWALKKSPQKVSP